MFDAHKDVVLVSTMEDDTGFIHLNNGADFQKCKRRIIFMIEIFDFQHALYEEAPRVPIVNSTEEKEKYDQSAIEWDKSNRVSVLMIKHTISSEIKNAIPDSVYAKEYLASVEEYFKDVLPI